jgi:hypothetical protein
MQSKLAIIIGESGVESPVIILLTSGKVVPFIIKIKSKRRRNKIIG